MLFYLVDEMSEDKREEDLYITFNKKNSFCCFFRVKLPNDHKLMFPAHQFLNRGA